MIKNLSAILSLCIMAALVLAILSNTYPTLIKEEKYPLDITSGSFSGINVDTDKIHFGVIVPGGMSERTLAISNTASYKTKAVFDCEGEICPFVFLEKNNAVLSSNENKNVTMLAKLPAGTEMNKTFEGNLTVRVYKRLF